MILGTSNPWDRGRPRPHSDGAGIQMLVTLAACPRADVRGVGGGLFPTPG